MLEHALTLYLADRHGGCDILAPGIGGLAEIVTPTHPVLRVSYLSPQNVGIETAVSHARAELQDQPTLLLVTVPCPDGPPYRCGVIFVRGQKKRIASQIGKGVKPALECVEYLAAVAPRGYAWGADLMSGSPGYFLGGTSKESTLWRITRVEFDFAGRQLFTLSPVSLANDLPQVDFSPIGDELLRQKLAADWAELQKCLATQIPYSLITAAKNVAESLVLVALGKTSGKMSLETGLKEVGTRLKEKQSMALPFGFLDYHLMSKMRMLHSQCHSDRVVISGRLVEPEFALTVVADLVQVLRSARLAH